MVVGGQGNTEGQRQSGLVAGRAPFSNRMQKAAEGAAGADPGKLDRFDRLECEDSKSQRPTCDLRAKHKIATISPAVNPT